MQNRRSDLIERLNTYRLEKRLSQRNLARELGTAVSTVNRWFKRRVKPNQIQEYQIKKLLRKSGTRKSKLDGKN